MKEYTVSWDIQLDAESPLEAAKKAFAIMRDPDSLATCFDVIAPNGECIGIDLHEGLPSPYTVTYNEAPQ